MIRGLFLNNIKAQDSIYESGFMVYQSIKNSDAYTLDYKEIDINNRKIPLGYDFYFFNYHPTTMSWLETKSLKKSLGFVITMVLEVAPNDVFVLCPKNHFDLYCALDPTLKSKDSRIISFPRPLEDVTFDLPKIDHEIPVIGTFGFATKGKGFQHVVDAVNKEFDRAIIKLNIPYGDFVPDSEKYAYYLANICKSRANPGIEVEVTHDFMTKEELIKWCNNNTLNCFLYDRDMPGLSATTDQAIVTERPLAVSNNTTFRHIHEYLPSYPEFSLRDSIDKSVPFVKKMKEEWRSENFMNKFKTLILNYQSSFNNQKSSLEYELPLLKKNFSYIIVNRYQKYKSLLKKISVNKLKNLIFKNEVV
ncbi:MAG: hypothetical protein ACK5AO_07890 [bacterium]|jgi:hypothetical protein